MRCASFNKSLVGINGAVLLATLVFQTLLVAIAASAVYLVRIETRERGILQDEQRAFWLTEAGLAKAIWNLMTPVGSGGQGEDWTTTGTAENLGDGSYTMVVARWDFALAANGSTASASSSNGSDVPANAIDGSGSTAWESGSAPSSSSPQFITVTFPDALTINKVRFVASGGDNKPTDYTWQVSSDGVSFTTVASVTDNNAASVTNPFTAQSNVRDLRLHVTKAGDGSAAVRIATLEAIGSKMTSTGTVLGTTRTISQTVIADDGSPQNQVAYRETDWAE